MTDVSAGTKAKATMHVKVIRKDGRTEEFDVPVTTDMTKEQVLSLIALHQVSGGRCREASEVEARLADGAFQHICHAHLDGLRAHAASSGLTVEARKSSPGLCAAQEG